jgi:hypothetical protein
MRHPLAAFLLAAPVLAQSNAVPGTDVGAYDVTNVQVYGRRGAAWPNGEAGMNIGHSMCNSGSVHIPWVGSSGGLMLSTFPKIATLIVRESNGRMVQISGKSNCKHSRTAFNFQSGPCAPCQTGPSQTWRVGCSDTYSSGFSSASNLGPTDEIDPWLGTWNPVGSYFDRGDPEVAPPANTDGIASTISTGGDPLKNRMIVQESDLVVPGTFYGQAHIVVIGEPGNVRGNNQATRPMSFSWNGSSWTGTIGSGPTVGPVLTRWTGATTAIGTNGTDDGQFMVGCKVTGPVNGLWHYEYAVHNIDNARGAAAVSFPVCPTARVLNPGFHDIDTNALNQWTFVRSGDKAAFQAAAGNPLNWNCIYNFWFDSDAAPVAGTLDVDQARPGPGVLTVAVAAQVPGNLGHEYLGAGCGSPAPTLAANSLPVGPNPGYTLQVQGPPLTATILVLSMARLDQDLGNGCTSYLSEQMLADSVIAVSDASGLVGFNYPIPAGLGPIDGFAQAAQLVTGGPWLSAFTISNGLKLRVGGSGCP